MSSMYRCCMAGHICRVVEEVLAEGSGGLAILWLTTGSCGDRVVNRGVAAAHNQRMLVRSNGLHAIEGWTEQDGFGPEEKGMLNVEYLIARVDERLYAPNRSKWVVSYHGVKLAWWRPWTFKL